MKEQQAIATRKLQGAWRRKAARLEERKSREYKELVGLSSVRQAYLIASMQHFAAWHVFGGFNDFKANFKRKDTRGQEVNQSFQPGPNQHLSSLPCPL